MTETTKRVTKAQLEDALHEMTNRYEMLDTTFQESMQNMSMMIDSRGWTELATYKDGGPDLKQLQDASEQLRNLAGLNTWIKRGAQLRANYVWGDGVRYEGVPDENRGARGGKSPQAKIDMIENKRYFFGATAREERERALYTDGILLTLVDSVSGKIQRFPLAELQGDHRNPDNIEEIWAYRRVWTHWNSTLQQDEEKVLWYWTDTFWDRRKTTIPHADSKNPEPVSKTIKLVDGKVNGQIGWAYGLPDAIATISWARLYKDFLINGKLMSDAMAQIWATAKASTKQGGDNAGMKLNRPKGVGQTAVMGAANELNAMSTAGKSYDFNAGRPLIAAVASAIEMSVVDLTSDPGAAGSSYGSAQTLSLPSRLAIKGRRQWHVDYDKRVLAILGAPKADMLFPSMDEATDSYRKLQAVVAAWSTGAMQVEELRDALAGLMEAIKKDGKAPAGIMLPNNEKSLARKDVDRDGQGGSSSTTANQGSPGQGQNNPAGNGEKSNDLRTDGVTEWDAVLDRLQNIVESIDKESGNS